jgi:hypothetical protein
MNKSHILSLFSATRIEFEYREFTKSSQTMREGGKSFAIKNINIQPWQDYK